MDNLLVEKKVAKGATDTLRFGDEAVELVARHDAVAVHDLAESVLELVGRRATDFARLQVDALAARLLNEDQTAAHLRRRDEVDHLDGRTHPGDVALKDDRVLELVERGRGRKPLEMQH